ncbi:MAG: GyrI-like domain-containing protein [Bacillota bacterium]
MNPGQAGEYVRRINLVTDYIDRNCSRELTLKELASVAGFSEYHFHRIFAAMTGETLFNFITRLRVERAATLLCAQPHLSVTRIAADCGFSSHAVFCRLFKKRFGLSPSAFRNRNHGQTDSSLYKLLRNRGEAEDNAARYNGDINSIGREKMKPEVRIEKIAKTRLAYIRYVGPYQNDALLFENLYGRLFAWAGPRGVDTSVTYILYHDDPAITEEAKLRISVCVPIGPDVQVSGEVCEIEAFGGTYAVGRFDLKNGEYGEAWAAMYSGWLPQSGYVPASEPCFERYSKQCDAEGSMPVDICIPVQVQ